MFNLGSVSTARIHWWVCDTTACPIWTFTTPLAAQFSLKQHISAELHRMLQTLLTFQLSQFTSCIRCPLNAYGCVPPTLKTKFYMAGL